MADLRADRTTDFAPDATSERGQSSLAIESRDESIRDDGHRANRAPSATDITTDLDPVDSAAAAADDLKHERFQIGAVLGEGGMGVVYRARDTREGRDVALKLMKGSLGGTARKRFEREFRALATMQHPHCLNVFDYGELQAGPFFTMELFEGRPITSLAGWGVETVLPPLLQVTLALDYIHHQGIIHRDVKPSNILVRQASEPGQGPAFEAKLMDFGLAKYYGVKTSLSAEAGFVGTVAYCAPEQLNNDELDHRADLYCLGLVSYELLSGRYPFPQARLDGMRPLMRAQLNEKPRPLAEISPDVPGPIAEAVMKYLRKEPRRRPDSAALLRSAIAACLGIDDRTAVSAVITGPVRPKLSVIGFVCRAREIEALEEVLRQCLSLPDVDGSTAAPGQGSGLIVVSGEPGVGKSSVVQEAERVARSHGCQVYEGRCFDGNLSPFQPFVEIIRQLLAELRLQMRREAAAGADADVTVSRSAGLPVDSAARLMAIVNDYSGELLRIAPELQKYLPGEVYRQSDFGREADYIYRALSAFFIELATLQPICLSFEDLQWADKSSLDLLRHLTMALAQARKATAGTPAASPRLVMIGSARTGYAQLDPFFAPLREQNKVMELALVPLTEAETRELIALRLNCRPDELAADLVARVHELCGGNPFFVSETVREWFEKAAITRSESGWVLVTMDADASDLPQTVRDAMRIRIEGLPAKTQQVLGAAAVIGAVVDIDLLRDALPDLTETEVLDAVDALLPRRVFRETGNADRVEFVHDLLRELPYGDLSASRRRVLHRRIGELLERRRGQGKQVAAAVLADHFRNAEDAPKAFAYSLEAAQAALDAYAFNNAITHLKNAQVLAPGDADNATLYDLWEKFGVAYGASGQLDDAVIAHQKAAEYAVNKLRRASANYGVGEAYHRKGEFERAKQHLDLALRDVGYPRPQSRPGRIFDMWRTSVTFHAVPTGILNLGRGPQSEERMALAADTYRRICQITGQQNVVDYTHSSYRLALFSKRSSDPEIVAAGYSKIGLNCGMFGLTWLGKTFINRAEKAAHSCKRAGVLATVQAHLGASLYFEGKLLEAETSLREAAQTLDKVGDWFGMFSHHVLRHIYSIRGDIPRTLAEAETEIAIAQLRGDADTLSWGQYGKADALARAGRVQEALEFAKIAVDSAIARNSMTVAVAQSVLGYARLQASDYSGARQVLEQSRSRGFRTMFLCEFMAPTFPMLVESLLGPHWYDPANAPSRAIVRKAWRESRVARFACTGYVNYYPHALRVSARAACALGKKSTAVRSFERSIAAAEKLGARYDVARGYLDIARVVPERREEYRKRGQSLLDELGAVVPEAERFTPESR